MIPIDPDLYPTTPHPTWNVVDTSKVNNYLDCPRQFLFRYVLGWESQVPNNHLIFGEGFHRAMAFMLEQRSYSDDVLLEAFNKHFLTYYRATFPESTDRLFRGKTPQAALVALATYAKRYSRDFSMFKPISVESSGCVPISPDRDIYYRVDAVCENLKTAKRFILEHKTGSGLSRYWTDTWQAALQPATYIYATEYARDCHDPIVDTCIMNGVHFKALKAGPKIELDRIKVVRNENSLQLWLNTVNWVFDLMEEDFKKLSKSDPNSPTLDCFNMNPNACTKYFGCVYRDFCAAWHNPLSKRVPVGFEINYWDCRTGDKNAEKA